MPKPDDAAIFVELTGDPAAVVFAGAGFNPGERVWATLAGTVAALYIDQFPVCDEEGAFSLMYIRRGDDVFTEGQYPFMAMRRTKRNHTEGGWGVGPTYTLTVE